MGMTFHDLPVVLCAVCGNPITFVEQATAITDKDGRRLHWDCWLKADKLPEKTQNLKLRHYQLFSLFGSQFILPTMPIPASLLASGASVQVSGTRTYPFFCTY